MTKFGDEITQKLFHAFMQFKQINWHDKQIAGYNPSEIKVLLTIDQGKPEIKVSEISKLLNVTSPTVTQIINKLEKQDLLQRITDSADRRAVNIRLTNKGAQIINEAKKHFSESFIGLIDYLGEEDSRQLTLLLNKVFNYYNKSYS